MRITVVTPVLSIAGVPLAQIRFARALERRGHDVTLLVGWIDPAFTVPELNGVVIEELGIRKVRAMIGPLCAHFRQKNPDVVFSAEDHLNCIVLLAAIVTRSKAKISCSSRVTPYDTYSNNPLDKRWILKQLVRAVMWRADALTCVSQDMVEQYRAVFDDPRHVAVYNIVDDRQSRLRMMERVDHPWLVRKEGPVVVAAGRLASWKGFADLIRAMALLVVKMPARLLILGDGPLRPSLQALVGELGLEDSVHLCGYVDNPLKYFARADVFALSSHVEGLPNVLVEAMMCGCTPVSTDCPTGPREVLADGAFGYLVPVGNPPAMAAGIAQALVHPISRARLQEAVQPFEESAVIRRHFQVLGLEVA